MRIGVVYPQTELGGDPMRFVESGKLSRTWGLTICWRTTTCSVQNMPTERRRCPVHTRNAIPSTTPSSCSPISPESPSASISPPGCSSCLSARRRSWPGRPPTSTCCRAAGSASAWASAGTTSSTRPSDRTSGSRRARGRADRTPPALFEEPVVDFTGRFDRVDRAALPPKPARPIPIWLGGSRAEAFDRAARLADGFIFFGRGIEQAVDAWKSLRGRITKLGRPEKDWWRVRNAQRRRRQRLGGDRILACCGWYACRRRDDGLRAGFRRRPYRLHSFNVQCAQRILT